MTAPDISWDADTQILTVDGQQVSGEMLKIMVDMWKPVTGKHIPGPYWVSDRRLTHPITGLKGGGDGLLVMGAHRGEGSSYCIAKINDFENPEAHARLFAASPELLSIARRWAALDGGAWHVERHASDKADLLAETRALIFRTEGSTP